MGKLKPGSLIPPELANKFAMLAKKIIDKGDVVDARCNNKWNASVLY